MTGLGQGGKVKVKGVSFVLFRDKDKPMVAKGLMWGSILAVIAAGVGATGYDLYLASTQWLLVAVVLAVWAVFMLLEAEFRL